MLFQYLSGFEPILYTTHTNEEPIIFNDTQVAPQNSRVFVRNQMINAVQPKLIGVAGREVVCLC